MLTVPAAWVQSVSLQSEGQGRGTEATVSLPLEKAADTARAAARHIVSEGAGPAATCR